MEENKHYITRRSLFISSAVLGVGGAAATSTIALEPADAKTVANTLKNKKTHFGFTSNITLTKDPNIAYRDLERLRKTGVKWIRTGLINPELVNEWGGANGTVSLRKKTVDMYVKFLKKAKSYGLKIILMAVEGYNGGTYSEYLYNMRQYWHLIGKAFGKYVDVWQVFNEPNGMTYRNWSEIPSNSAKKDAYYKELGNAIGEFRKIVKKYNKNTRVTTNLYGYPVNDATEKHWKYVLDRIHKSLDLISIDAYPSASISTIKSVAGRVSRLKKRYKKNVMIAETGINTCATCEPLKNAAAALKAYIDYMPHKDTEAIIFYMLRDSGKGGSGEETFGIYNYNGTKKAYVYDTVAKALKNYYGKK